MGLQYKYYYRWWVHKHSSELPSLVGYQHLVPITRWILSLNGDYRGKWRSCVQNIQKDTTTQYSHWSGNCQLSYQSRNYRLSKKGHTLADAVNIYTITGLSLCINSEKSLGVSSTLTTPPDSTTWTVWLWAGTETKELDWVVMTLTLGGKISPSIGKAGMMNEVPVNKHKIW